MNAISHAAEHRHDRAEPIERLAEDWVPTVRTPITDEDVEELIRSVADSGTHQDMFGNLVYASPLCRAVARQWVKDKEAVGEIIGPDFWRWAKAMTSIEQYGIPSILHQQATAY